MNGLQKPERTEFDVAVIGAGSGGETLLAELADSPLSVVVFEPGLVGGECPFVACMPSKAMLHDAAIGAGWDRAVNRRELVVDGLNDSSHAADVVATGATLVRERAQLVGPHTIRAAGTTYDVGHIVLATGSTPTIPAIDGIDELGDRRWTSADALTATERPARLTIIGGGVIGCELATIYARFGTEVHLLDTAERAFPQLSPQIGEILDDQLQAIGVRVHRGVAVTRVARRGGGVRITLENDAAVDADRLLVATGTKPNTDGLGLDALGFDPGVALSVADDGRLDVAGSLWAIGDVAGRGEYTHLANHQARVVANVLAGDGLRRFDDAVQSACVFTDPPIITVGPAFAELSDRDVFWVSADLSEIPRATTDELTDGYLSIAVHRDRRTVVAADGIGAGFDQLASALVTAVDGRVPIDRLARSVFPFPTVGELLGVVYTRALDRLAKDT